MKFRKLSKPYLSNEFYCHHKALRSLNKEYKSKYVKRSDNVRHRPNNEVPYVHVNPKNQSY